MKAKRSWRVENIPRDKLFNFLENIRFSVLDSKHEFQYVVDVEIILDILVTGNFIPDFSGGLNEVDVAMVTVVRVVELFKSTLS